jgi:Undecaprenyl-phosphate glucose phosphotransferase
MMPNDNEPHLRVWPNGNPVTDGTSALQPVLPPPAQDEPARGRLIPFARRHPATLDTSVLSPHWMLGLRACEGLGIVLCGLSADVAYHAVLGEGASFAGAFWAAGLLAAVLYVITIHGVERAQPLRSVTSRGALRDMFVVWLGTIGAVAFFILALKSGADISRGVMMSFALLGAGSLVAVRVALPRFATALRSRSPEHAPSAIVIGVRGDAGLNDLLAALQEAGVRKPAVVRLGHRATGRAWDAELAATKSNILETARKAPDGDICVAAGGLSERELHDLILVLQPIPRAVRIVPSSSIEQYLHFPVRSIGRLLAVEPQKSPLGSGQMLAKRMLDVGGGTFALLVLSPVLIFAALAIKLETRGAVLFRQDRLGHKGKPFSILKFRTMTVAENGDVIRQASADDCRVTRVGRVLRRLSIDELPQLLNVIRGEMSLVGPRPHAVAHDRHYSQIIDNYELRQHVKPGITGWAQIHGLRGATTDPELMRQRVAHDIWYAKNASVMLDLHILLLTIVEVFRQRNAH